MNHLTPEEVEARRAEARKLQHVLGQAAAKAKRSGKIKSKSYRKIQRKEREKLVEKLGDAVPDDADDEEARLQREVERARERATLRHKNTGKWAKAMRTRGELDVDQLQELNDMRDRGEKLRRRIQGVNSGDEESGDDDTDSADDVEAVKATAFDELRALRNEEPVASADGLSKNSVLNMKFMQDAMKRDMHRVNQTIDDFMTEIGGQLDGEDRDTSEPPPATVDEVNVQRSNGRVSYRPGQTVS
jgi:U3 small nucleolar RNA-associated protein 14